jgi:hypothetical protein
MSVTLPSATSPRIPHPAGQRRQVLATVVGLPAVRRIFLGDSEGGLRQPERGPPKPTTAALVKPNFKKSLLLTFILKNSLLSEPMEELSNDSSS